jgi:low affinity Fe/Cu permease
VGIITRLARYMASPFAFLILFGYGALWYLYKPETFEWHAGATMATWFMTLVIQRAEHRDTQAIHVKLDEMLHVLGEARNELTRVDEDEPEESKNAVRKCARMIDWSQAPSR